MEKGIQYVGIMMIALHLVNNNVLIYSGNLQNVSALERLFLECKVTVFLTVKI